jgi:hypothetical protein
MAMEEDKKVEQGEVILQIALPLALKYYVLHHGTIDTIS